MGVLDACTSAMHVIDCNSDGGEAAIGSEERKFSCGTDMVSLLQVRCNFADLGAVISECCDMSSLLSGRRSLEVVVAVTVECPVRD